MDMAVADGIGCEISVGYAACPNCRPVVAGSFPATRRVFPLFMISRHPFEEIEAAIFDRWCSYVGIKRMIQVEAMNPVSWKDCLEFKAFKIQLERHLRCENELIAQLIVDVLKNLNKKFERARDYVPSTTFSTKSLFLRRKTNGSLTQTLNQGKNSGWLGGPAGWPGIRKFS